MSTQDQWCDWLAEIGFGIDFGSDHTPPCTLNELAGAYIRVDPGLHGCDVDDIAGSIVDSYGWEGE